MFQLTFAVITAALISGAIADRVKLSAWLVFLPLWVTLSYFPLAHMVFSCTPDALICTKIGAQDYAGGTAVHINAGVAGLVLALIIGKRVGFKRDPMRPHSLPLTMIGAGLLWVGWYGFNVGSIVFGDDWSTAKGAAANLAQFYSETGRTFTNTTLATMAAMLGWLLIERLLHGKATTLGAASGIVAGLVAITPACGAVDVVRRHRHRRHRRWGLCLGRRAEVQVQPRRLARRGRRPPRRRHRRHDADRPVLHLGGRGRRRRPVLRRRLRLAGRPDPGRPGRHRLVGRRHRDHRLRHQVHDRLAHRRGGRGQRRHRPRPAR